MFIQTETTPNPMTLKFIPGQEVLASGSADFPNAEAANRSPLAQRLFEVDNVERVFFGTDFISVTKSDIDWAHLKPAVLGVIMEHFTAGLPVMDQVEGADDGAEDNDTVRQIKELLDTRVRPVVAQDGGDIVYHGFEDGVVFLHMQGACAGCPSSSITLKHGIENMLKHYIPEVSEVRQV